MTGCAGFVVLCNHNHKLHTLLVYTHNGKWGFPKGKIEKNINEDLQSCAYRELKEETGLEPKDIIPDFDKAMIEYSKKGQASVTLYYATTQSLIPPKIEDVGELASTKWVPINIGPKILPIMSTILFLLIKIEKTIMANINETIG